MSVGELFFDFFDQVKDAVYQFRLIVKKEKSKQVFAKVIRDNRKIDTYPAQLTGDELTAYIPKLQKVYFKPVIYDESGFRVMYIPDGTHGFIDHEKIKDVAKAQKYSVFYRWLHGRNWLKTETILTSGTISWDVFSQDFSPQFTRDSGLVIQGKLLTFIEEMSNSKMLLVILASFLGGFMIGAIVFTTLLKVI